MSDVMLENPGEVYEALRISQLDAAELDTDLSALIKSQLQNVFKYIKPSVLVTLAPEIDAAVGFILWHFSVRKTAATFGQQMLDMRYIDEASDSKAWISSRQRSMLALLTIGGAWFESRVDDFAAVTRNMSLFKWVWKSVRFLSVLWKCAALINFLVFLTQGKYVHCIERILKIRSVFPNRHAARQVGFELMDRELLWHGFAEFLFFVLPLVNFWKLKNLVSRNLFSKSTIGSQDNPLETDADCIVCGEWPVHPCRIVNCPHVFCYYCLHSNYMADVNYSCPVCATPVLNADSIQRVVLAVTSVSNP